MKTRLKELREYAGMDQQTMADKISELMPDKKPIKKATYGSWERGDRMFNAEQLCAIATVLDCSCDLILGREIRTDFDDPREAELHRTWRGLSDRGKHNVLHDARAEVALEGGGATKEAVAGVRRAV